MQYGIAILPTREIQEFADSWRRRYDPYYDKIVPHLTVREREEMDESRLAEAVHQLKRTVARFAPFSLLFNRVSTFYPVTNTLYLAPERPETVIELHHAVCQGSLSLESPKYVYTPHITIAQEMSPDELHDLYGRLRMMRFDLKMDVNEIHLFERAEDGRWSIRQSFALGG
jgi:2''-5'' RNA ligase